MADCQMHLVNPEVAAYHTYTWIEPGLKVLRDTLTWGREDSTKTYIKVVGIHYIFFFDKLG